jgi:pimeloyl-ACP methyl ester carboxylesterase
MLNGIGTPAAMWAPLMAELTDFQLFAVDLPGYGLTDTKRGFTDNYKHNAVRFLADVCDGLGLDKPSFVANSLGSLWTSWLALEQPKRVAAMVHVGCPAIVLDTSAPLQMRLLSIKPFGRFLIKLQPPSEKQVEIGH